MDRDRRLFARKTWLLVFMLFTHCVGDETGKRDEPEILLSKSHENRVDISSFARYKFQTTVGSQICSAGLLSELNQTPWYLNQNSAESLRIPKIDGGNWLKIRIQNDTDREEERVVVLPQINLPIVELCSEHIERGEIQTGYAGYKTQKVFQVFLTDFPHFNVLLKPRETVVLYLSISSFQDLNLPLLLVSVNAYKSIVFFRFLLFLLLVGLAMIFVGWSIYNFKITKHIVYLAVGIHYFSYFILEYFVYGKEIASLFGNQSEFIHFAFFVFMALHHFAFFFYLRSWQIYRGAEISNSSFFNAAMASGLTYILVPSSELIYENRIFILLFNFGVLIFYFYVTHRTLRNILKWREQFYFFGWFVFLLAVFYKLLYHFDFYPFHSFTQYASTVSLPIITFTAFMILEFLEREKQLNERRSTLLGLNISELSIRLDTLIAQEKLYLKSDISEEEIATRLGIGLHQVSELVNTQYSISLPALLNRYRVEEAKLLLREKLEISINDIPKLAGFGSRSAFYLEFKKQVGIGPSEFRKKE
jgi:AraC-like DNA-binding protein